MAVEERDLVGHHLVEGRFQQWRKVATGIEEHLAPRRPPGGFDAEPRRVAEIVLGD